MFCQNACLPFESFAELDSILLIAPQWDPNAYPQGLKTSLYYPGPYQGQPQVVGDQQQPYEQLGPDSTMNSEVPSQANSK